MKDLKSFDVYDEQGRIIGKDISLKGDLVEEKEQLAQRIERRFKLYYNEYFLDKGNGNKRDVGIPLHELNRFDLTENERNSYFIRAANQTDGVLSVTNFFAEENQNSREYRVNITVSTIYGEIALNFAR